jgi:antitoxin PrlF
MATMTSKGQLTVPKEVRELLGLRPGDRVDIQVQPDGTARLLPATLKVRDVFGMLAAYRKAKPVTIAQMKRNFALTLLPQKTQKDTK